MDYIDKIDELIYASGDLLYGDMNSEDPLKYEKALVLLKKARHIAKENNDLQKEYFIKTEMIYAYGFTNKVQIKLMEFIWCINHMNKIELSEDIVYNLSWNYKFIAEDIYRFHNVSLEKIDYIFENMKSFYEMNGMSLKPYYINKIDAAIAGAYPKEYIDEWYKQFLIAPADKASDCKLCNLRHKIGYYLYTNDLESIKKTIQEILNEKTKCPSGLYGSLSEILLYLYENKEYNLAENFHLKSIRKINGKSIYYEMVYHHILYLSNINTSKALKIFENNYKNHIDQNNTIEKMYFDLSAYILFSKMDQEGIKSFKMRLPRTSPVYKRGGYDTNHLINYFKESVIKSKDAFDQRNNNTIISKDINKILKICNVEKLN
ncbi:hypothetical protein [Inediibacterium massiliense]|uniref:hypothetical protein n=1 Tax=Inediibacterium massiliense TaxID=1658111 RepID=UPI0006B4478E|nr:hypothetical protein [Inediibacterium massiliense]